MIRLMISLAVLMGVAYVALEFAHGYATAAGSAWQRAVAATKGSATILWQRFVVLVTAGSAVLVEGADLLGAPGVGDGIKAACKPEYVALATIAIAVVSELARRRTLKA